MSAPADHEKSCAYCAGLFDDSDGPEYGPPWMKCSIKPHMGNLVTFPFRTEQKCFEPAYWVNMDVCGVCESMITTGEPCPECERNKVHAMSGEDISDLQTTP